MLIGKRATWLVCAAAICVPCFGQTDSGEKKTPSEAGAVMFYGSGGWSFGMPAVRASVSVGGTTAMSPEKKTLSAASVGMGVRAWKWFVPFVDFTGYDTGKASASVGSVSSQVQADTFSLVGGLRLVGRSSRLRPYAEFGGGAVFQKLSGSFSVAGRSVPASASGSLGAVMYGGGLQVYAGRKWGSDLGFDAFTLSQPMNGAGRTFGRERIGIFYQTKSTVQ